MYLYGGEDEGMATPHPMTIYNMATGKAEPHAKPPRPLQFAAGLQCRGCCYSLGGWDVQLEAGVGELGVYNPGRSVGGWGGGRWERGGLGRHLGWLWARGGFVHLLPESGQTE